MPVWSGSFTGWRSTTPGALNSSGRVSVVSIGALAVERVAERVDDAADQRVADGDARDAAGAADGLALLDVLPVAEERGADVVLLEVEREAGDAVLELEHLERDGVLEPVDARDAVADLQHGADLGEVGLDVELLDPLRRIDVISSGRSFNSDSAPRGRRVRGEVVRGGRARTRRRMREPAWRTRPPIRSGSTLRVASTFRPDAFSIWPTIAARVVVGELDRRRQLDLEPALLARRRGARTRAAISSTSPARPFSASRRRKLRTSSSEPPSTPSSALAFARGSSCGFRSTARSSGTSPATAHEVGQLLADDLELPFFLARRRRAPRRRCGGRRLSLLLLRAPRSRARGSPPRSGAGGRRRRAPCRSPSRRPRASSVRDLLADLLERAPRLGLDLAAASPRAGAAGRPRSPRARARAARRRPGAPRTRISSASCRACPIRARCSSSSLRASSRARSASSIDCRIRSRRSSIVFWIGPNANRLSTKSVDQEADDRPDHQPRRDLDQWVGRRSASRRGRRRGSSRAGRRTRPPR